MGSASPAPAPAGPRPDVEPSRISSEHPVLISGGGIGGLAAGLALAKRGIASHIIERRGEVTEEGAGLQLGPNATRILADLGVAEMLEPLAAAPQAIHVRDGATGKTLARLPLGAWIKARHGAPYWVAHRQDLHGALLARVRREPLVRLTHDFSVADIRAGKDGVEIATRDGRSFGGAALAGADGVWSTTRSLMIDPEKPRFTGRTAVRTVMERNWAPEALQALEVGVWLLPGQHIVHYPVRGGRDIAMVIILDDHKGRAEEGWSLEAAPDWVQRHTRPFAQLARNLVGAATQWRSWSLFGLPTPARWSKGRVTLLGDAAHPLLPHLAQGAVMALEDAVVLADALARPGQSIEAALRTYEGQRLPRARRVVNASARNGRIYHMEGPLAFARDLVMGLIPAQRVMAGYDWLYGWRLGT